MTRHCLFCGAPLVQRPGERADKFASRRTCNIVCARRHGGRVGANNNRFTRDWDDWWRPLGPDPFVPVRVQPR